jgi:transglutaminase-like putative cysteine protease
MQMHIRHETRYRYERPVKYSVQSLHLTPRRDMSQRALNWSISAPGRRLEQVDAYGNISHLLTIEEPHREIHIVVSGVVETADIEGRQDDGPLSPLAYLAPTLLTAPNEDLKAFANATLNGINDPRECRTARRWPSRAAKACARTMRMSTSPRRVRSAFRRAM